ncbi:MAG: hypothetical protein Q8Q08_04970 [Candidatus Omnitrophota bacterium]|nr:hypothetical protein [Candidatus Omnitrophota bacterium]MDZ4241969.1 hypothetical protein [Candidatus Omnitrophota bacterium]
MLKKIVNGVVRYRDSFLVAAILFVAAFHGFDFFSDHFGWMGFQERDYARACRLLLGRGLSPYGPEATQGGYIFGPALTLLYSAFTFVFGSPRGIHILLQFSFLCAAGVVFYLAKRHFNRTVAYLSLLTMLSSQNYVFYSFTGWHASLIIPASVMVFYCYDLYVSTGKKIFLLMAALGVCLGISFHFSMLILIPVYMILLGIFNRKEIKAALKAFGLAVVLVFGYYFLNEIKNDWMNTKTILGNAGTLTGDLLNKSWLEGYWPNFATYVFYNIRHPVIEVLGIKFYPGILSAVIVAWGMWCLWRDGDGLKKVWLPKVAVLTGLVFLPVVALPSQMNARHFQLSHPAFEVLLAVSIFLIIRRLSCRRAALMLFVAVISAAAVVNMDEMRPEKARRHYFRYAVAYNSYQHTKLVTDLLLSLDIPPDIYENNFYYFFGVHHWPFDTFLHLPSNAHYQLLYKNQRQEGEGFSKADPSHGYLLIFADDLPFFNPKTIEGGVINVLRSGPFYLVEYKGPYIYRQIHEYSTLTQEERELQRRAAKLLRYRKAEDYLYLDAVVEIPAAAKNIRYLQKLFLLRDANGDLIGYTEIVGRDLRQSHYGVNSPYFIKDPVVVIHYKDGSRQTIEVLKDHFYSTVPDGAEWEAHKKYGKINEVQFLGNLYVESPYGVAISIPGRQIRDIRSVTFQNGGYGRIDLQEDSSKIFKKAVNL